jgi:NDP-sugar pyrophosphorylase family protein
MQIWDCQVVSEDGISFQPISIGDHCTIGQRTVVMPGCQLEDRVTCGSESILLKDTVVEKNGTVVGNPPTVFFSSQRSSFAGKPFICPMLSSVYPTNHVLRANSFLFLRSSIVAYNFT